MRELTYYIGSTLDGRIGGPAGQVDFFPISDDHVELMNREYPEVLPTHARRHLGIDDEPNRRFDTAIMGHDTYRPGLELGITDPYAHLRTIVVSRRGVDGARPPVEVVDEPVAAVRDLKAEASDLGIWLVGGGSLAAALADEIDRIVLKLYPVLAGAGVSVLAGEFSPRRFELVGSVPVSSGCTVLTYERRRPVTGPAT